MHVVIVTSFVLSLAAIAPVPPPAPTAPVSDPCQGELDAVVDAQRQCRSPVALTSEIAADAVIVEAPERDPQAFPGELAFVAVVSAVVGGGVIASTLLVTPDGSTDARVQQGTFGTGVGLVSLGGLLAAAAVGTWVFNPATGAMQLPIFDGESR